MAEASRRASNNIGVSQPRANLPFVLNHHQMLKEIRDNLKHLRREPETQAKSDGKETDAKSISYPNTSTPNLPTSHTQRAKPRRFQASRNGVGEGRRGLEPVQGNRNYDESGYSSSSSECSSLSANDLNGGQQFMGNMPLYNEVCLLSFIFEPNLIKCTLFIQVVSSSSLNLTRVNN